MAIVMGGTVIVLAIALIIGFTATHRPSGVPAPDHADRVLVSDRFSRTVANDWGKPDKGAGYVVNAPADFDVADGSGTIRLPPGAARTAMLDAARPQNLMIMVDLEAPVLPKSGGGLYVALMLRSDGLYFYRATLRFAPDKKVYLSVTRFDGADSRVVTLKSKIVGKNVPAGRPLTFRFQATGTSPVALAASMSPTADQDSSWQLEVDDDTASRLVPGGSTSLWCYLSGSSDSAETIKFDNLELGQLS